MDEQGDASGDRKCSSSVSAHAPYSKELSAIEEGLLPFFQVILVLAYDNA